MREIEYKYKLETARQHIELELITFKCKLNIRFLAWKNGINPTFNYFFFLPEYNLIPASDNCIFYY